MEKIGLYQIQREIGKGGMGIIYKSLDPRTQKSVAIKVLPPHLVDRSTVERFNREAQALIKLKCPNLAQVYDFGVDRGKHYMVMEFVEGETLKAVIKNKGALSISEAMAYAIEIAQTLMVIHRQQMIHRDIKSANIMITPDHKVKVMDFGLVKDLDRTNLTIDGSTLGTVEYMSPEQITGKDVDYRTDIYSLGVTLYEMLTGRVPFSGESPEAIFHKHKNETPLSVRQIKPEIPIELEMLVTKAMAKDRSHRYQDIQELLADLERLSPRGSASLSEKKSEHTAVMSTTTQHSPSVIIPALVMVIFIVIGFLGWKFYKPVVQQAQHMISQGIGKPSNEQLRAQTESSLKDLEKAEQLFSQGQAFMASGEVSQAVSAFESAIQLRDNQDHYYRSLALAYEQLNDRKKALKTWGQVIKYSQDPEVEREAQTHVQSLKTP